MWSVALCVIPLLIIITTHWVYRWRNPRCKGILPPGSMGFPLIGESIEFFMPSHSIDVPDFIKKRVARYGPLFRTSVAARPLVISTDAEFNHFILQQEGKLVESWYLDSYAKIFGEQSGDLVTASSEAHKYRRNMFMNHFGLESLKERILPQVEEMAGGSLESWSSQASVEVRDATSNMISNLTFKLLFGDVSSKSCENLSQTINIITRCLLSFPLNIPGTTFYKSLKAQKKMLKMIKDMLRERRASPERSHGGLLDHAIRDMKDEKFLTEDFIVYMLFSFLFVSFKSTSATLTSAMKLLTDHPSVLKELTDEHEAILKRRVNVNSTTTWEEYKSMTFTSHVINETLRLANVAPMLLRRAITDIEIKGYTIPAGWTILIPPSATHLNPEKFEDPLAFNPWRWKDLGSNTTTKDFKAFGSGPRRCAGAEFTREVMIIFLHVLVSKYRWTKIKGGDIVRTPALEYPNGFHIKVFRKD